MSRTSRCTAKATSTTRGSNDPVKYPVATRAGKFRVRHKPDLVTPKLGPLHYYQLALPAPKPPPASFNHAAAARGEAVFNGQGRCADCHMPPLYTDAGYNAHKPAEICTDSFQADRWTRGRHLRHAAAQGLWARSKRGFYHDGRHPDAGGGHRSLQQLLRAEPVGRAEERPGPVPEVAVVGG